MIKSLRIPTVSAMYPPNNGPILPLYFHDLGVTTPEGMSLWSGLATGITFLIVCLAAPFWGRLADRKGRKITLIRSSFGMALCNV